MCKILFRFCMDGVEVTRDVFLSLLHAGLNPA